VKLASFNVENLFERAIALNTREWAAGRPVLEKHAEINKLLGLDTYTAAVKQQIVDLLIELGLERSDDPQQAMVRLRQNHGKLLTRHHDGTIEVVANGRADWIGWVELKTEPVDELATQHTAMVLRDVGADIQAVVEAENRPALRDFSKIMLESVHGQPFPHVMLIDGNDDRGIDVGILFRDGYELVDILSHVDDTDAQGQVFSRDCPEYLFTTPAGNQLRVLVNHLKSKGFGSQQDNDARRRRQAARVKEIYDRRRATGEENIAIVGDFNDYARNEPLSPLFPLLEETDLKDVSEHQSFTRDDTRPGTFDTCTARDKFDYILLSPALFAKMQGGEVFRKGLWGGTHGDLWEIYPTIKDPVQAASDHAAIWAEIDI
jgi:endonuclease/exonuclease/phosphatase family metal-dependent hydrolase